MPDFEDPSPPSQNRLTAPFLLLAVFYFLAFFAGYQLFAVMPLHLRDMGASLAESGRFMGGFTLGSALGSLFTGPLGDRLGQRRVLRVASLLMVVFFVAYGFLPTRWGFFLLAPIHGLLWSGLRTASMTKAGSMLAPSQRAEGMAFFGMAGPGGVALGPLVGLLVLPFVGFKWLVLLLGAAYLLLHVLIKSLPGDAPSQGRTSALFQLPDRSVLVPVLILFLLGISFGPIPPYSPQEAKFLHEAWPSALITTLAGGMVGMRLIIGLTGMGRRPIDQLRRVILLTLAGMVLLALMPGGLPRHILGGLLYGAGYGMVHTLIFMVIIERSQPDRRGAAVGALYFSYDAGQAVGVLLAGGLMEAVSHRWGLAMGYRSGWALAALALGGTALLAGRVMRPGSTDVPPRAD